MPSLQQKQSMLTDMRTSFNILYFIVSAMPCASSPSRETAWGREHRRCRFLGDAVYPDVRRHDPFRRNACLLVCLGRHGRLSLHHRRQIPALAF